MMCPRCIVCKVFCLGSGWMAENVMGYVTPAYGGQHAYWVQVCVEVNRVCFLCQRQVHAPCAMVVPLRVRLCVIFACVASAIGLYHLARLPGWLYTVSAGAALCGWCLLAMLL